MFSLRGGGAEIQVHDHAYVLCVRVSVYACLSLSQTHTHSLPVVRHRGKSAALHDMAVSTKVE